jgi:hypothetical protein
MYRPDDYPVIVKWWESRGIAAIPAHVLHPCGVVVEDGEHRLLGAAWLYQDNATSMAWIGWPILSTEVHCRHVLRVFDVLLGGIEAVAKSIGRNVVHAAVDKRSLKKWFAMRGFIVSAENVTSFIKVL